MECEHDFVFNELHGIVVCRKCGHVLTSEEKRRACNRGMELLKAEETEEYVSRKSVEDAVRDHWCDSSRTMEAITRIPAADMAPVVHGKWKPTEYPIMSECEDCSECGYRTVYGHRFKFCPNCGTRMDL
jgi:hypothetical protein